MEITEHELLQSGWTESLITEYLPQPIYRRDGKGDLVKTWDLITVRAAQHQYCVDVSNNERIEYGKVNK